MTTPTKPRKASPVPRELLISAVFALGWALMMALHYIATHPTR